MKASIGNDNVQLVYNTTQYMLTIVMKDSTIKFKGPYSTKREAIKWKKYFTSHANKVYILEQKQTSTVID